MIKLSILILVSLSLTSCLSPTERRQSSAKSFNATATPRAGVDSFSGGSIGTNGSSTSQLNVTPTPTPTASTTNTGYENCDFNTRTVFNSSSEVGPLRVCPHSSSETKFRVRLDREHYTTSVCFIPTFKDEQNNTTYLGPAICTFNEAMGIKEGVFSKSRPGFSNYPINGMMVMMSDRVPSFFACMDANTTAEAQIPSSPLFTSSVTYLCDIFVRGGQYIDIRLNQT